MSKQESKRKEVDSPKLIYEWVKTGVVGLPEFRCLINDWAGKPCDMTDKYHNREHKEYIKDMKNKLSVESVRSYGYQVDVYHIRNFIPKLKASKMDVRSERPEYEAVEAHKGGKTVVRIRQGRGGRILSEGVASCSPADMYNKKRGIEIALGRAVKNLSLPLGKYL
jgi:hypothetical protein